MKTTIFCLLILGSALILSSCRWTTPYKADAYGKEIPVMFVGDDCLSFPPGEAEEAIDWLRYKVNFKKFEKLKNIKVYKDHIKINSIIESAEERKKRLAEFRLGTKPKGRTFIMKTREGHWFLTEVKE